MGIEPVHRLKERIDRIFESLLGQIHLPGQIQPAGPNWNRIYGQLSWAETERNIRLVS